MNTIVTPLRSLPVTIPVEPNRFTPDDNRHRSPANAPDLIAFPAGVVSLTQRKIRYADGGEKKLTRMEAALLSYLVSRSGRAVPRAELLREVWGLHPDLVTTRTVDMHVAMLRRKLRDNAQPSPALRTVNGLGYLFELDPVAGDPRADSITPQAEVGTSRCDVPARVQRAEGRG